jgi:Rne/Rng family ribonuclease
MKEPTGNKGPRLTGNITMPGRYVVLMPFGRGVNLSRRIKSESERNRLRALAILVKPAGMGLLVRTGSGGKTRRSDYRRFRDIAETMGSDSARSSIYATTSTAQPRR